MNKIKTDKLFFAFNNLKKDQISLFFLLYFIFILIFSIYNFIIIQNPFERFEVGSIAKEDIVIHQDITVVDEIKTQQEKENFLAQVQPVYNLYDSTFYNQWNNFSKIFDYIKKERPIPSSIQSFIDERTNIKISDKKILYLLILFADNESYQNKFKTILYNIYSQGVILKSENDLAKSSDGFITVDWFRTTDTIRKSVDARSLIFLENKERRVKEEVEKVFGDSYQLKADLVLIEKLILDNLAESLFFDQPKTDENKKEALNNFSPKVISLKSGSIIIRHGDEITYEKKRLMELATSSIINTNIRKFLSTLVLLVISAFIIFLILYNFSNSIQLYKRYIVYFFSILIIALALFILYDIYVISNKPMILYFPFLLFYFLIEFAFPKKEQVWIFFSFILPVFILSYFDENILFLSVFMFTILYFINLRTPGYRRSIFVKTAVALLLNLIYVLLMKYLFINEMNDIPITIILLYTILNILLSMVFYFGLQPIIEYIFNFPTIYKLMEISDLNNKFFSEFLMKAPGTYHHSVIVANLSENAAKACGANPYIAKAGGLYHDIGKIKYARYFVENQQGENPTVDVLNPKMAVSIIKNHVKSGLQEGAKLKLPREVMDIIEQHHGTSLISFFYSKALSELKEEKIEKDTYRYNYPKPHSRESAIVMIADAIEAASRTLKTAERKVIESLVDDVIDKRSKDGQLEESVLTLADLKAIKETMITNLSSMLHGRIQYPDEKYIQELEKKERLRGI